MSDAMLDMRTADVRCPRCGGAEKLPLPMAVDALTAWVAYFDAKHRACRPAPKPPAAEAAS